MKLGEAIKQAVREDDAEKAGQVADVMRFKLGMNYDDSYALVKKLTGIDLPTWDGLLYEADYLSTQG